MADISNITVSAEGVDTVCKIKDKVARNDIALNRTTLGTQCKNLCNVTYTTRKVHTVNITVNSDKSLGLLTDSTTSIVCVEILTPLIRLYANVTYILTGTNNGNIRIELRDSSKSNILVYDSGSGVEYTPNKDIDVYVCLRIEKSISITSLVTVYPMLRIKGTDDTYEPYKESVDTRILKNKSDIVVNKTTLGYTTKNLLKITTASKSGNGVTITVNDDKSITVNGTATSAGVYAVIGEADVIAGNKYILNGGAGSGSTYGIYTENYGTVLNFGSDNVYIPDTTGKAIFRVFVRPNVTISNITFKPMLRDADIIDATYEPYQPSLKEQVPYSISLPSKSTSESYSYNGVPTMICLTPSESVSSGGGLYLINSVGTAVYLIDKTGIVINTDTTNKTFTITNNTASTYDVYISCAYKKE